MTSLFPDILNISLTSSILILAITILRFLLKKAPKYYFCILWGIAGLRLIIPFSFENNYSPIPSYNTVNQTFYYITEAQSSVPDIGKILTYIWLGGVVIMGIYGLYSYLRINKRVAASLKVQNKVYMCDNIDSPFILGIIAPKIYIPSDLDMSHLDDVLRHERAHLSRGDNLWKPLGYLILTLHWFNPLVWVAYVLLCRDIEKACDEKVISKMGSCAKIGYLESLVVCSVHKKRIAMCPVAFGEIGVKSRVKLILSYKRPTLKLIALCLLLGMFTVGFLFTSSNDTYLDLYNESFENTSSPKEIDYEKLQSLTAIDFKTNKNQTKPSSSKVTVDNSSNTVYQSQQSTTNTSSSALTNNSSLTQSILGTPSSVTENQFLQRKSSLLQPVDPANKGALGYINQINEMNQRNRQGANTPAYGSSIRIFP